MFDEWYCFLLQERDVIYKDENESNLHHSSPTAESSSIKQEKLELFEVYIKLFSSSFFFFILTIYIFIVVIKSRRFLRALLTYLLLCTTLYARFYYAKLRICSVGIFEKCVKILHTCVGTKIKMNYRPLNL